MGVDERKIPRVKRLLFAGALLSLTLAAAYGYGVTRREANYRQLLLDGDAAVAGDELTAALEAFSAAVGVKPDSMAAYLKRGEVHRRRNDLDAALRDLRRAADLDPTAPRPRELLGDVSYAMGRFDRAAERYQEYLALDDSSYRLLYKLALSQYRAAQPAACITNMQRALAIEGQFAEGQYVLGLCLRDAQRPREALLALQRSVKLAPALLQAREELADIYGRLGRTEDRIAVLNALWALDPEPSRQVALGLAHAAVGDFTSAVQTLSTAARDFPDYSYTYVALGRVWLDIAQTREDRVALEKALEALHSAARVDDNAESLMLLGRALLQASDPRAAEDVLFQATNKLPTEPMAFVYLGNAAEQLGHTATARDALVRYYSIEAGASEPRRASRFAVRIGDLSMRLRDYPAAVLWYQRAIDGGHNEQAIIARLADAKSRAAMVRSQNPGP